VIPRKEKGCCDTLILKNRKRKNNEFVDFCENLQIMNEDKNVWSCLWLMATMIQLEKYKKTREAQKQYYYSRTTYKKTEKELRTIIEESNKLRDTIKEQLKEAQKSREDENEIEKIRSQIENLQKLVEKARTKIRPFHKPHFSTKKERPQNKQTYTGPRAQHHKHRPWTNSRAGGHMRK